MLRWALRPLRLLIAVWLLALMGAGLAAEVGETVDSNMGVPARAGMAENTETPEASEHRYANGMTEKEVAKKMHSASRRTLAKVS